MSAFTLWNAPQACLWIASRDEAQVGGLKERHTFAELAMETEVAWDYVDDPEVLPPVPGWIVTSQNELLGACVAAPSTSWVGLRLAVCRRISLVRLALRRGSFALTSIAVNALVLPAPRRGSTGQIFRSPPRMCVVSGLRIGLLTPHLLHRYRQLPSYRQQMASSPKISSRRPSRNTHLGELEPSAFSVAPCSITSTSSIQTASLLKSLLEVFRRH
jgi:hypothetical protein